MEYRGYVSGGADDVFMDEEVVDSTKAYDYYRLIVYKSGKPNGIAREYYRKGNILKLETPYLDGEKNGIEKYYSTNGAFYSATPYKKGKIDGILKEYFKDGKIMMETTYRQDSEVGKKQWDYKGNRIK